MTRWSPPLRKGVLFNNRVVSAVKEEVGFKFPAVSAIAKGDGSKILVGSLATQGVGML